MYSVPACRLGLGSGLVDAAGTLAEAGAELAGGVAPRRAVASGLGTPVGVLSAGLQAKTVHERVPSRKVLRLTSNPIPRLLVLDRPGSSQCFRKWQSELPRPCNGCRPQGAARSRTQTKPRGGALFGRPRGEQTAASVGNRAPPPGGGWSGGALSSARDDDGGGFKARCASSSRTGRTEPSLADRSCQTSGCTCRDRHPIRLKSASPSRRSRR